MTFEAEDGFFLLPESARNRMLQLEEQIGGEPLANQAVDHPAESFGEPLSFVPDATDFALGPDDYLEHLRRIREAVEVPVIGSLNGTTPGGWLQFAELMEEAGASALELNAYQVAADPHDTSEAIEERMLGMVRSVVDAVDIPVAVKLAPFFTSLTHFARRLDEVGAKGIVLFNRFYQPDIDPEEREVLPVLQLSDPRELTLRLRWLAILSDRVVAHLAVTGGVHGAMDAIKAIMAGADAVQMVSALLRHGPEPLKTVRDEVARWMEEREYESLEQMQGSMDLRHCPDPSEFERGNYMRVLQGWRGLS